VTGGWRQLDNEELRNLYSSSVILVVRTFRSRSIRRAWHVACLGVKGNACRILVRKPEGKDYKEDEDVGGWIILKWVLEI
jgi:hypothetical protein